MTTPLESPHPLLKFLNPPRELPSTALKIASLQTALRSPAPTKRVLSALHTRLHAYVHVKRLHITLRITHGELRVHKYAKGI